MSTEKRAVTRWIAQAARMRQELYRQREAVGDLHDPAFNAEIAKVERKLENLERALAELYARVS